MCLSTHLSFPLRTGWTVAEFQLRHNMAFQATVSTLRVLIPKSPEGWYSLSKPMAPATTQPTVLATVTIFGSKCLRARIGDSIVSGRPHGIGTARRNSTSAVTTCARMFAFWATPPHDGVLAEYVWHPAALTYRLPGHMTNEEGALMEPLAVGVHACERGGVRPGCVVAKNGAETIGFVTLMTALAYGSSQVILADMIPARLQRAKELGAAAVVDARSESLAEAVMSATRGQRRGRRS